MFARHETEAKDLRGRHRDDHRSMNDRHQAEYEALNKAQMGELEGMGGINAPAEGDAAATAAGATPATEVPKE